MRYLLELPAVRLPEDERPSTMRTGLIVTGRLHLGGGVSLPAQQHGAPFIRWEPVATSPEPTTSWRTAPEKSAALGDYRYEGLAFGGVVFGALGVWMGSRISAACPLEPGVPCPSNKTENAVLTGAIIGGAGQCSDCSQQPTAGNGALALGLVGAGAGGVLGFLAGLTSPKHVWIPRGAQ